MKQNKTKKQGNYQKSQDSGYLWEKEKGPTLGRDPQAQGLLIAGKVLFLRVTDVENKCMDRGWGGRNWETGIDTYTLLILCIK